MPIMNVQYTEGDLDATSKADLARRLTNVLIRMEGGAGTHGGRAFATVLFTERARGDWWVGGVTDDTFVSPPGRFLVHVGIPEGYMSAEHRNEVHAWVAESILASKGADPKAPSVGSSILVVIDEVAEGDGIAPVRTSSTVSVS